MKPILHEIDSNRNENDEWKKTCLYVPLIKKTKCNRVNENYFANLFIPYAESKLKLIASFYTKLIKPPINDARHSELWALVSFIYWYECVMNFSYLGTQISTTASVCLSLWKVWNTWRRQEWCRNLFSHTSPGYCRMPTLFSRFLIILSVA